MEIKNGAKEDKGEENCQENYGSEQVGPIADHVRNVIPLLQAQKNHRVIQYQHKYLKLMWDNQYIKHTP